MKKCVISFVGSYIMLSLYFYLIPMLVQMNDILRFIHLLIFFPFAFLLAKILFRKGLESYGLIFFKGWQRNLALGLIIGFCCWSMLFGLRILLGEYAISGIKPFTESLAVLLIVVVGFGAGSLISDMIVRGLVYHHFKERLSFKMTLTIAVLLYAMDDVWLEGFSVNNFIFSMCLGISFAYSFYKTNSIWANTGLHAGLNIAYGLFFGVAGSPGAGIFHFQVENSHYLLSPWLSSIMALIMFLIVHWSISLFHQDNSRTDDLVKSSATIKVNMI